MEKIIRNAIRCRLCGDVIESRSTHDFVWCSCQSCAVDGGHSCLRRLFKSEDVYEELAEVEKIEDEKAGES